MGLELADFVLDAHGPILDGQQFELDAVAGLQGREDVGADRGVDVPFGCEGVPGGLDGGLELRQFQTGRLELQGAVADALSHRGDAAGCCGADIVAHLDWSWPWRGGPGGGAAGRGVGVVLLRRFRL